MQGRFNARIDRGSRLHPLTTPVPGLFPAAFGHQEVHQVSIGVGDGRFALPQRDNLVLATSLFQGARQPVGNLAPFEVRQKGVLFRNRLNGFETLR